VPCVGRYIRRAPWLHAIPLVQYRRVGQVINSTLNRVLGGVAALVVVVVVVVVVVSVAVAVIVVMDLA